MTTRVAVAHRSQLIRDVVRTLGTARDIVVVGETSRPAHLLELCGSEGPDVAVTEATFEDGTPIESLLPPMQAAGTRAVVVGGDPSPERLTRVLLLGAAGYLEDDASPEQVLEAIQIVAGGGSVLGPWATATILEQWRRLRQPLAAHDAGAGKLTARERDVLRAMAEGLPAKSIAGHLGVAVKTVESHKFRIFEKLGVHSQAQAVSLAITHGILAGPEPAAGTGAPAGTRPLLRPAAR